MNLNNKLRLCIFINFILLLLVIITISFFSNKSDNYWNYGPNDKLVIISVSIDTWKKYFVLLGFIAILKSTQCVIQEIAHPILGQNIYNPDKKEITEFTKLELQFYGNSMYLIDGIRRVFTIMITISQIDIAVFGVIISELTSIYTVRLLLNAKKFTNTSRKKPWWINDPKKMNIVNHKNI